MSTHVNHSLSSKQNTSEIQPFCYIPIQPACKHLPKHLQHRPFHSKLQMLLACGLAAFDVVPHLLGKKQTPNRVPCRPIVAVNLLHVKLPSAPQTLDSCSHNAAACSPGPHLLGLSSFNLFNLPRSIQFSPSAVFAELLEPID